MIEEGYHIMTRWTRTSNVVPFLCSISIPTLRTSVLFMSSLSCFISDENNCSTHFSRLYMFSSLYTSYHQWSIRMQTGECWYGSFISNTSLSTHIFSSKKTFLFHFTCHTTHVNTMDTHGCCEISENFSLKSVFFKSYSQ